MWGSEEVLRRLEDVTRQAGERVQDFTAFHREVLPQIREVEGGMEVESASMSVLFRDAPTAGALVDMVDAVDREARRAATGMARGVPPHTLHGRGVRLVPRRHGLVVEEARRGSLDVVLLLGGIYITVTSQPVSFALNLAGLLGYARVAVRALKPENGQRSLEVRVPAGTERGDTVFEADYGEESYVISTPTAQVILPKTPGRVRLHVDNRDGSRVVFDLEP